MAAHITTAEAKKQALPGFDVYRYSHLLYHDDLNRDFGVVRLNVEAMKAFSDTVTITQRKSIAEDQAAIDRWHAQGGFQANLPFPWWGDATRAKMEYVNYEHFKIASAFELHLKARLLARDFVLHEIDARISGYKSLATEQASRPIGKFEVMAIQPYYFDGKQNYLPGLKDTSLKFSLLTDKPSYRSALGLTDVELDIIRDYRVLRNQIHFPGDPVEMPNLQAFPKPIVEFLIDFINREIVAWSNTLITQYKMNYLPLVHFN